MSGIYGVYQYDGSPVTSQRLERMREAMSYYGPHGGGCRAEGTLGLGHLLLEVNPEDAFEKQPVPGARGPVVSAARLDNREALLETFSVPSGDAPRLSDGHLVSLAFDRWGEELCSHLQGDWALAAWDARERRLLLARDACGSANLYYYEGKGFIAFASSLKALLVLPGVVKEPDCLRLAQVLVSWQHDAHLTAYKGFRRLVWAHAMTVGPDGHTRIWRHWSPEGRDLLTYRRDAEYEEAFLEHYTRAVQSCLRTERPVAATLSGGRDWDPWCPWRHRFLPARVAVLRPTRRCRACLQTDRVSGDWATNGRWPAQRRRWRERTSTMSQSMRRPMESSRASNAFLTLTMVQVMRQATNTGFKPSTTLPSRAGLEPY